MEMLGIKSDLEIMMTWEYHSMQQHTQGGENTHFSQIYFVDRHSMRKDNILKTYIIAQQLT